MISFFDKLVIKSNPQAKEEIMSLKNTSATSKPKIKECMKSSRPGSVQTSSNSSGTSERTYGEKSNLPKKRDTCQHKGAGGTGGSGDGGPPKPPGEPAISKGPGVNNTELIKYLHEQLIQLLNRIRDTFEHMIETLHPEAQGILTEQFKEFYNYFLDDIQKNFNQLPSDTSLEEINEIYKEERNIIECGFREQIVSEINSYILIRSHNHAKLRGDNPHLPYIDEEGKLKINTKPKKAQLLERNKSLNLGGREPSVKNPVIHNLQTPFGSVDIRIIGIKFYNQVRTITPQGNSSAPSYDEIDMELKKYAYEYPNEMQGALNALESYLKSPCVPGDNVENVLHNMNSGVESFPTEHATLRQRTMLAVLAGILLLCESGEDRSNQGGKRERALISDLKKMVNSKEYLFTHYVPADAAVLDKTSWPYKTIQHGGNVRGKIQVGKVNPDKVGKTPISKETLESDKERTGYLEFSSDSEKDYDKNIDNRDIFEIDGRKYSATDNPGPYGGCLWRILINNNVSEKDLHTAANNLGIPYNYFVNIEDLERLLGEINRLGNYNLAFHIDVFDYLYQYQESISGNIPASLSTGSNIIYIALIYDHTSGEGHYVEKKPD